MNICRLLKNSNVNKLTEASHRNQFEPASLLLLSLFGGYWLSEGGPPTVDTFFRYPVPFLERFVPYNLTSFETATDPIDDLSRWPIPNGLARFVAKPEKDYSSSAAAPTRSIQQRLDAVSVLGLMTVLQGGPSVIAGSSEAEVALEVCLFGAAHIVRDTEPDALLNVSGPRGTLPSDRVALHRRRVNSIAEAALGWFADQLPQRVFPERLERIISETTDRSYND